MPKTTFVTGTKATAAFFNAIQDLQFDGLDIDGHYQKIPDSWLSTTPGNLLPSWTAFKNALSITSVTGLTANYSGGTVTSTSGTLITIASGSVLLANNATSFVFVDRSGVVSASLVLPAVCVPLAQITTVGGAISGSVIDLRPRFSILPVSQSIKVFGGLGAQGAYNLTTGSDTLAGEYYFTDFNVSAGATLNITGTATIYCSGNVTIAGTVIVAPAVRGGAGYNGSFLIQDYPSFAGSGLGGGNALNIAPAQPYHFATSPIGSGGAGGWLRISGIVTAGTLSGVRGGNGGGAIVFEAAGTITVTGTISAIGEAGQDASSIVMNPANCYSGLFTGGGGGSGGLIFLRSLRSITASAASSLLVSGGRGGNGFPNPASFNSAGGGGGGYVVCYSPSNNLTGATITLTGGTAQYSGQVNGSVSGGSFAGVGGFAGQAGSVGMLVLRSIIPV
jgi:hypothetical protein